MKIIFELNSPIEIEEMGRILSRLQPSPLSPEEASLKLSMHVRDAGFTVRTENSLLSENIVTLGDIVLRGTSGIRKVPNVGRLSLIEIREVLSRHGLFLKHE